MLVQEVDKAFRPCTPADARDCEAFHIRPGYLPYKLRSLDPLYWGDTNNLTGAVEVRFFNVRLIVSRLTGVSSTMRAFSSKSRIVHRLWPSGTGPQAISMIFASVLPSTFQRALSEFTLRSIARTLSSPCVQYVLTVLLTVAIHVPVTLAHYL